MKKGLTDIIAILDRSGSMNDMWHEAVEGLVDFVEKQQKIDGEAFFTLAVFDSEYMLVHNRTPIKDVDLKNIFNGKAISPRGMTALLDAIGKTFNTVGEHFANTPEDQRPEKVIAMITTDGHENSSREFSRKQIADMIKLQQDTYNWEILFLGANIDSFAEAGSMGVTLTRAANFSPTGAGVAAAYATATSYATRSRAKDPTLSSLSLDDVAKQAGIDLISTNDKT